MDWISLIVGIWIGAAAGAVLVGLLVGGGRD